MKNIVIVTGATSGVGREFVRQLDGTLFGKIDEIWAVARSAQDLARLADETYAHVRPFALDLTREGAAAAIEDALAEEQAGDEGVCVKWLVNSAGCGWFGPAQDMPAEVAARMVRLNCLALTELVGDVLPFMQPGSRIVNMASVAAWLPLPGMGLYAATKRFVLDLTRGLNEDLRGTGISATAVCPKAVKTGFWDDAGADEAKGIGFFFGCERVYDVVRRALRAAEAGRGAVVTDPGMKVACSAFQVLPYGVTCGVARAALAVQGRVQERRTL